MGANPRVVTADVKFTWDHATQRLGRGTIIDVPADSPLERAIGRDKLIPLHRAPSDAAPEPAAVEPAQKAPRTPVKAKGGGQPGGERP
jgi:hypothetical protein